MRFGKRSFNAVNFQRPDWVCGSFYTPFKLARLVEITNLDKGGEYFFPFSNRSWIKCWWPCINSFFFDGNGRFLADKACHLIVQSRNNFWKFLNPGSGPLALRKSHFHGILVPEQALSQGAVEMFNTCHAVQLLHWRCWSARLTLPSCDWNINNWWHHLLALWCPSHWWFYCCSCQERPPSDLSHLLKVCCLLR